MRIDHIAYRTFDREKTVEFFVKAFGYKFQAEFEIYFNDEKTEKAMCTALEPPERTNPKLPFHIHHIGFNGETDYHMAPEIFVSQGTPGSIVHDWCVANRPGLHHIAYNCSDVEAQKKLWIENGWAEFTSDKAFKCDDLTQIFSKPNAFTGHVYEFIERKGFGFCASNVRDLIQSTVKADKRIP